MTELATAWLAGEPAPLLRSALEAFVACYGDAPVRVFRCPGRINLRGMHVDTHGGFLNLMSHQREVVVVCSAREDGGCRFVNVDTRYQAFEFSARDYELPENDREAWLSFIAATNAPRGSWQSYATGAVLRAAVSAGNCTGINACVASDLPEGAALSSSSALCLSVYLAACGLVGHAPSETEQILACRDAEWFAGARTGTSDPAAMVLGRPGQLVNVSLLAEKFSLDTVRRLDFPSEHLAVLIVNSRTTRSLSGAQLVDYISNRFAYSVALDVFRQEMEGMGYGPDRIAWCDRLSHIAPELFGGVRFLAALLMRVPERLSFEELRRRYALPHLDALVQQYFGTLPEEQWPKEVPLRGPLVYGLAESRRGERFFDHMQAESWEEAGRLMFVGHAGDRLMRNGEPYDRTVYPLLLAEMGDGHLALEHVPGDYGASSPVLDALVDTANKAGALGACLTGAGIAGSVLALCLRGDADAVREAWVKQLSSEEYARLAGFDAPPDAATAAGCVVENLPVAPAGEMGGSRSRAT